MPEPVADVAHGLLDTSVLIGLGTIPVEALPTNGSISTVTLAELAAGPHLSDEPTLRAERQHRLQMIESMFDPIPFDLRAARAHGLIAGAVFAAGRKPRGARSLDLMIAATALAHKLVLYTRNPADFAGLDDLIEVRAV